MIRELENTVVTAGLRPGDAPVARPVEGGPSFSFAHRLHRSLWRLTWLCLAAWTPAALSPWRVVLLRWFGARMHAGSAVAATTNVWLPRNLEVGPRSALGPGVNCYNMAPVKIGARTIVSQNAVLCAGTHDIGDPDFPLRVRPITIGDDVWIASEAFVGPGVQVADGCVLGARGCAFSELQAWTVYRGNPAQPVKERRWRHRVESQARPAMLAEPRLRISCVLGPFFPVPPVRGGAVERIWQTLCEEFATQGHDVTLVSRQFDTFPDREVLNGVRHVRIKSTDAPKSKILYRLLDLVFSLRVCRALEPSDVTITNSVSLPLVLPRRRAGIIYMSIARFPKGQKGFYRRVDRMQSVSTHVGQAIREQSPSVAALVKTIPNAISDAFATELDKAPADRVKQILYVGRVAREKGLDLLIRAFAKVFARHPGWSLTILGPHAAAQGGDGEAFLSELKALADGLGAPVDFAGPVYDQPDLIRHMRESGIFVYPSVAARGEALPLAPVEAMACGCTVLVSSLDCFKDYLDDGVNGAVFDETDDSGTALADRLGHLIGDDALRLRLGIAAVQTARGYTRQVVARKFLADFADLRSRRH